MNPIELLFVPTGRIARLPYFLGGLGALVAFVFIMFLLVTGIAAVAAISGQSRAFGVLMAFGFVGLLGIAYAYVMVVLTIKRLHDLGWSGWHVVWIIAVSFFANIMKATHSPIGTVVYVVASLAWLGVSLWLLFAPGERQENDYGEIFA